MGACTSHEKSAVVASDDGLYVFHSKKEQKEKKQKKKEHVFHSYRYSDHGGHSSGHVGGQSQDSTST